MGFDWSTLGQEAPTALVRARHLAHHAAQWPAKAARANLGAATDDNDVALSWDEQRAALMSQALPGSGADVRIGLRIAALEIVVMRGAAVLDTYSLEGRSDAMIGVWFDSALRALGLQPASDCALPFSVAYHPAGKRSAQVRAADAAALEELARWFAAADDALNQLAARAPVATAVRCSLRHFGIATDVSPDGGIDAAVRPMRIGFSAGDAHYAQPYAYVTGWPHSNAAQVPALAPAARWHTEGFIGAVISGEEILMLADRRQELVDMLDVTAKSAMTFQPA
jgi:hypothetical protein